VLLVGAALALALFFPVVYTTFIQVILAVTALLTSLALAIGDRRSLARAGHDYPASPAWVLLTPLAYLIARYVSATRETGRNTIAPLVVFFVALAVVGAALIFVTGFTALLTSAAGL